MPPGRKKAIKFNHSPTHWDSCIGPAHFSLARDNWSIISVNTLRPRQNGRHFADDIFKCIFLNENVCILIKISLKFVPQGTINNIPALVQIMAWRRPGNMPLSGPMMVRFPTHICVTRPQWVKHCHRMFTWKSFRIKSYFYVVMCVYDVYALKSMLLM